MKRRNAPLALCALGGASALLLAETLAADTNRLPSVDIIGSNEDTFSLSGSAHVLSNEDLEKKEYTDVHRILRDVPGVYVQEEEGYGLRPNIGIRGAGGLLFPQRRPLPRRGGAERPGHPALRALHRGRRAERAVHADSHR